VIAVRPLIAPPPGDNLGATMVGPMGELRAGLSETWGAAGLAAAASACAFPAMAADPPKPAAVFSGMPAEIARRDRLTGPDVPPPCSVFDVRLRQATGPVRLTTNGLGDSRLAPAPGGTCPQAGWEADIALAETAERQPVALKVGDLAAAEGFGSWKGRVVAYGPQGDLGGAEVSVIRTPALPLWPEFKWFVGFVLPALAAFGATRLGAHLTKAAEEREALATFRTVEKATVDAVVAEVVTVLGALKTYEHPGWQVLETLRTRGVVKEVPSRDREPLLRQCERDRMGAVARRLMRLFPLHANDIEVAARSAGLRTWGP